jgi:hypothetical protein
MTWLPIIISNMLAGTITAAPGSSSSSAAAHAPRAALLSTIPYVFGGASTLLLAWHADRANERTLHFAAVYVAGGAVLACFVPMYRAAFAAGFVALVVGMMTVFAGQPVMICRVRGERVVWLGSIQTVGAPWQTGNTAERCIHNHIALRLLLRIVASPRNNLPAALAPFSLQISSRAMQAVLCYVSTPAVLCCSAPCRPS